MFIRDSKNISSKHIINIFISKAIGITNIKVIIPKNVDRALFLHNNNSKSLKITITIIISRNQPNANPIPILLRIPLPPYNL